jgi:hypothetical protein
VLPGWVDIDADIDLYPDPIRRLFGEVLHLTLAEKLVGQAKETLDDSAITVRGVQQGVQATAVLLQTQAESLKKQSEGTTDAAEIARENARKSEEYRDGLEGTVKRMAENVRKIDLASEVAEEVKELRGLRQELLKARSFALVLLRAHAGQTVMLPDPCLLTGHYELTLHNNGIRGKKRFGVDVVPVGTRVRTPDGREIEDEINFEDAPTTRRFERIKETPFEAILDFRYYTKMAPDFIAVRIRPQTSFECAASEG